MDNHTTASTNNKDAHGNLRAVATQDDLDRYDGDEPLRLTKEGEAMAHILGRILFGNK